MSIRTALLTVAALVCFALAYRFGSHGIRLHDHLCIGLACAAVVAGMISLAFAFRTKARQPKT